MSEHDDKPDYAWRAILAKRLDVSRFQPLYSIVELDVGARSDCGLVQTYNSDHFLALRLGRVQHTLVTSLGADDLPPDFQEYGYALLVADGLGEQGAGIRASRVALSAIAHLAIQYGRWNVRMGADTPGDIIEQGEFLYRRANEAVLDASRADDRLAGMAATLTAIYIVGVDLFFAHVGHGRAFLFRDGVLVQLTTDHTLQQAEREAPGPKPLAGSKLDVAHVVTETIGGRIGGPDVEIEHVQLWSDDRILLCTNGLTDVVTEEQIADVLALRRAPEEDCRRLIERALAAGAPDNVTVVLADYRVKAAPAHVERAWPAA
jgi:serine/threonine protein phosphatase PrpC